MSLSRLLVFIGKESWKYSKTMDIQFRNITSGLFTDTGVETRYTIR